MRYGSICSGIEAATVAWHPLGFEPAFFSEIDKQARAVLQHHYPDVPCHGDFTTITGNQYGAIDILIGGTPCQSFSMAGLRKGLDDARGNLTLEFVRLVKKYNPRWVVWENVPGVLSANGGRAFGSFLGGLAECGYGFAYRILDAQYFGVPQRRRRVFVIGYLGDWRRAATVLFEPESLLGDITPRRAQGEGLAPTVDARAGRSGETSFATSCGLVSHTLRGDGFDASEDGSGRGTPIIPINMQLATRHEALGEGTGFGVGEHGDPAFTLQARHHHALAIPIHDKATRYQGGGDDRNNDGSSNGLGIGRDGDPMPTLDTASRHSVAISPPVTSKWAKGSGGPSGDECQNLVVHPQAFTIHGTDKTVSTATETEIAGTVRTRAPGSVENSSTTVVVQQAAFKAGQGANAGGIGFDENIAPTLGAAEGGNRTPALMQGMAVRRITPRECERLQGFPDDYTLVEYKGAMMADGPRYKMIGNSMHTGTIRWLGERIKIVEAIA